MTAREKDQLVHLNQRLEQFMREQHETNVKIHAELMKTNRGLYGDKDNQRGGLIHKQEQDEKRFKEHDERITKLETWKKEKTLILHTALVVAIAIAIVVLLLTKTIDLSTIINFFR